MHIFMAGRSSPIFTLTSTRWRRIHVPPVNVLDEIPLLRSPDQETPITMFASAPTRLEFGWRMNTALPFGFNTRRHCFTT